MLTDSDSSSKHFVTFIYINEGNFLVSGSVTIIHVYKLMNLSPLMTH